MNARAERRHAAMMARGAPQPVILSAGDRRTTGEARVATWDRPARMGRLANAWAACWGLAVASVLLPAVHFVLVPAFLIAGPVLGIQRARQKSGVLGGEGPCPSCGERMDIDSHPDDWPLFDACAACQAQVVVEKAPA